MASAASAARNSSTPVSPPMANAGAISSGKPTPCGSFRLFDVSTPRGWISYG
jgi:hypothetical protein